MANIHTRRLAQFLEMESMGQVELKKTVESAVPRELSYHDYDGKIVNARELLISEGIQGSTLIPTEILATVVEGAEPIKCMREVLPIVPMKGMIMKQPYGETGTYAPVVAEGAEIPIQDQTYTDATFTAVKYAVRPLITNEMIDDALFGIIAEEIRKSGMRMENALNYKAIDVLLSSYDSGNLESCTSGATPLYKIANMVADLNKNGFEPSHLILHPVALGLIMQESIPLYNQFAVEVIKTGAIGDIMGCRTFKNGIALTTSTTNSKSWGFAAANAVGAIMVDNSRCGAIGMRQDMKVEQYADSIRQMQGVSVSMRFDVQPFIAKAIAVTQYNS